jgi:NAD(P)H-dependent FMN reductase
MHEDDTSLIRSNGYGSHDPAAIIALSGSSRTGSRNARLLDVAVEKAIELGSDVTLVNLRDLDLPIYDHDLEEDELPQAVLILRQLLAAHDGLMIATPEYNGSVPALLKNALDWSSRPSFGLDGLAPYKGKAAVLMTVCDAATGGVSVLNHLRTIMCRLGVLVMPEELRVPGLTTSVPGGDAEDIETNRGVARLMAQFHVLLRQTGPHGAMR